MPRPATIQPVILDSQRRAPPIDFTKSRLMRRCHAWTTYSTRAPDRATHTQWEYLRASTCRKLQLAAATDGVGPRRRGCWSAATAASTMECAGDGGVGVRVS
eukprot:2370621-Pleurochrysis_carterae.AAC.1